MTASIVNISTDTRPGDHQSFTLDFTPAASGNFLLCILGHGSAVQSKDTPPGWTLLVETISYSAYYRVATGGLSSVYFNSVSGLSAWAGVVVELRGVSDVDPINASYEVIEPYPDFIDCHSITTTVDDCLVFCGFGTYLEQNPAFVTSGIDDRWDVFALGGLYPALAFGGSFVQAEAGATPVVTIGIDTLWANLTYQIAIAPGELNIDFGVKDLAVTGHKFNVNKNRTIDFAVKNITVAPQPMSVAKDGSILMQVAGLAATGHKMGVGLSRTVDFAIANLTVSPKNFAVAGKKQGIYNKEPPEQSDWGNINKDVPSWDDQSKDLHADWETQQ